MSEVIRLVKARRPAREAIVQALYQMIVANSAQEHALRDTLDRQAFSPDTVEFIRECVLGIALEREWLESRIKPLLAKGWEWHRVATTDRAVILLAAFELWYMDNIPPKVSISEAVVLAKKFGDQESGRFVNGLLGRLLLDSPKAKWEPADHEPIPDEGEEEEIEAPVAPELEDEELEGIDEAWVTAGSWSIRKDED